MAWRGTCQARVSLCDVVSSVWRASVPGYLYHKKTMRLARLPEHQIDARWHAAEGSEWQWQDSTGCKPSLQVEECKWSTHTSGLAPVCVHGKKTCTVYGCWSMLGLAETSLLCCLLCLIPLLKEVQASYETKLGQVIILQAHQLIGDTTDHIDKPLKEAWTKKRKKKNGSTKGGRYTQVE